MPRFTLIEVYNFPQSYHEDNLYTYLKRDGYRHREDIDFASEAEVKSAIAGWGLSHRDITRLIVQYENIGHHRWRINRLIDQIRFSTEQRYAIETVRYRTSLFVNIDQSGRMCSDIMPSAIW